MKPAVGPSRVEDPGAPRPEAHALGGRRPLDVDVHARRQRVDDRQADAVQAARGDVRAATELAAGVQLGGDHLDAGQPGLGLLVGGDAATVVVDLGRPVGVQGHLDGVRGAGQRLVDPVVDDLPQAVHETAGVGGADVHARALAHRLEPLEDEEVSGVVGVVGDRRAPAVERWCCLRPEGSNLPAATDATALPRLVRTGARHAGYLGGGLRSPVTRRDYRGEHHEERTIRPRILGFRPGSRTRGADFPEGGTPIHGWPFRRMRSSQTFEHHVLE